jgi:hypothetical protein
MDIQKENVQRTADEHKASENGKSNEKTRRRTNFLPRKTS